MNRRNSIQTIFKSCVAALPLSSLLGRFGNGEAAKFDQHKEIKAVEIWGLTCTKSDGKKALLRVGRESYIKGAQELMDGFGSALPGKPEYRAEKVTVALGWNFLTKAKKQS